MPLLSETAVLPGVLFTAQVNEDGTYRLAYGDLVVYENGQRCVRGRRASYEVRSVEKLRYDFERDVEAAGGSLG